MIAGFLSVVFAAGFMESVRKHVLGSVGTLLLILGDISLIAIGVFPSPPSGSTITFL